jgi:hypothetical protein
MLIYSEMIVSREQVYKIPDSKKYIQPLYAFHLMLHPMLGI